MVESLSLLDPRLRTFNSSHGRCITYVNLFFKYFPVSVTCGKHHLQSGRGIQSVRTEVIRSATYWLTDGTASPVDDDYDPIVVDGHVKKVLRADRYFERLLVHGSSETWAFCKCALSLLAFVLTSVKCESSFSCWNKFKGDDRVSLGSNTALAFTRLKGQLPFNTFRAENFMQVKLLRSGKVPAIFESISEDGE